MATEDVSTEGLYCSQVKSRVRKLICGEGGKHTHILSNGETDKQKNRVQVEIRIALFGLKIKAMLSTWLSAAMSDETGIRPLGMTWC